MVTLLRAIAGADPDRAALAVSALSPVFPYVTEGDGFHRDGSFIRHGSVPYQGGYGAVLLTGLATLFAVLRGTPWQITDPAARTVLDAVDLAFAPFVHDGACMDLVRGRGIARRSYGDHRRGREIAAAVLLLAETAPKAERARWRAMVKGWAVRDTARPMLRAAAQDDATVPAAAVGRHLYGLESTLEAYTSWFFLDDAVVCLGAGITCRDGVPVETVVDNRRTGARLTLTFAGLADHEGASCTVTVLGCGNAVSS